MSGATEDMLNVDLLFTETILPQQWDISHYRMKRNDESTAGILDVQTAACT
jgi:hypothetical protein